MEVIQTWHRKQHNGLSFFMSCLGIAFIASIYALFVFFENTIPHRYEKGVDISEYNFFSYSLGVYFRYWQWLLFAITAFAFTVTLFWMKYRIFSIRNIVGLVLFVGGALAIFNFPVYLTVGWFPYSLLLKLAFLVSLWYGGKLCDSGKHRYTSTEYTPFGRFTLSGGILSKLLIVFFVIYGLYIYNEFPPKLQYIYSDSPLKK